MSLHYAGNLDADIRHLQDKQTNEDRCRTEFFLLLQKATAQQANDYMVLAGHGNELAFNVGLPSHWRSCVIADLPDDMARQVVADRWVSNDPYEKGSLWERELFAMEIVKKAP
jgi:hypothetical protein